VLRWAAVVPPRRGRVRQAGGRVRRRPAHLDV